MSKVVTVTLNPSLDRTLVVHYLNAGYHNRTAERTRLDPAGRGVSITRALHQLGTPTTAVVLLGNDATARAYTALIESEGIPVKVFTREGLTRSNIIIYDTGSKQETRLIEESSVGTEEDLQAITETVQAQVEPGDLVVLAGQPAVEAPAHVYEHLTQILHDHGARVALACHGEPLNRALRAKPEIISVNTAEIESLFNFPVRTRDDAVYAARKMIEKGAGQVVVPMLHDQQLPSAILVTEDAVYAAFAQQAEGGTHSGVEEALFAGILEESLAGRSPSDMIRLGTACAAYTASQLGNAFGTMDEVRALLDAVESPAV